MQIFVYLDESGSIHKNSNTRYFAVGGYFTIFEDKNKIISLYRRINKEIKDERNINLNKEIKSYHMLDKEKIKIITNMQLINSFCGCSIIFDKNKMKKEIVESNIFFNYAIKILFKDCIMPLISLRKINQQISFFVSIDNRNIRVKELNNLENYLNTEFCLEKYEFKISYYDSASNYGIQLADLIVNTFYNSYKNVDIVKNVLASINWRCFRTCLFPGHKIRGRIRKLPYNIRNNN